MMRHAVFYRTVEIGRAKAWFWSNLAQISFGGARIFIELNFCRE
jgi:hypothetical protein